MEPRHDGASCRKRLFEIRRRSRRADRRLVKRIVRQFVKDPSAQLQIPSRPSALRATGFGFGIALPIVVLIGSLGLFHDAFSYDDDEGLNVMKALLVLRGHELYTEIWNDQPPVFTYLLTGAFRLPGESNSVARCLVAVFAWVLVGSLCTIVVRLEGLLAGVATAGLLVSSLYFVRLSFSAMIGLPSLALATAALWGLIEYRLTARRWAVALSAVAIALAMQTKLSAALVVPVMLLAMFIPWPGAASISLARRVAAVGAWLLGAAALFFAILFSLGARPSDLLNPHLKAREGSSFISRDARPWLVKIRKETPHLLLLAAASVPLIALGRRPPDKVRPVWRVLPLAWMGLAFLVLREHRPFWYHHVLLLSVPLAWAGGAGVRDLADLARGKLHTQFAWRAAGAMLLLAATAWCGYRAVIEIGRLNRAPGAGEVELVDRIAAVGAESSWIYTDKLVYAVRARRLVPPALAIMSAKRAAVGELSNDTILSALRQHDVRVVALSRSNQSVTFRAALEQEYRLDWQTPSTRDEKPTQLELWIKRSPADQMER